MKKILEAWSVQKFAKVIETRDMMSCSADVHIRHMGYLTEQCQMSDADVKNKMFV